jgi:hypothetical protein
MEYNKGTTGNWLNADTLQTDAKVKILTECVKQESKFKDKDGNSKSENIVKVRVQGADNSVNMRLNWATIYGFIEAYGTDSKGWVGKIATAKTVDAMVGDTMRTIVYLIPDGFELKKNEEKKLNIVRIGDTPATVEVSEDINPEDTPF